MCTPRSYFSIKNNNQFVSKNAFTILRKTTNHFQMHTINHKDSLPLSQTHKFVVKIPKSALWKHEKTVIK